MGLFMDQKELDYALDTLGRIATALEGIERELGSMNAEAEQSTEEKVLNVKIIGS